MKVILLALLLAISAHADEKKDDVVTIWGKQTLAKFDQKTGKVTYEDNVDKDEVVRVLIAEIALRDQDIKKYQQALAPKPEAAKKKP